MLPTTVIGSHPQPEWLIDRQALAHRAPPRVRAREIWRVAPEHLAEAQDDATLLAIATGPALSDEVITQDLIVDGSACIGQDCVNGESFGFDTIRLKENNLRIKFDDTSVAASFPRTDWQLTANASANGRAMLSCAKIRCTDTQTWPAWYIPPLASGGTISVNSASGPTMTGAAPPCSRAQRVPGASCERSDQPTPGLPIKLKNATRGSVTKAVATSRVSVTVTWHHSSGSPASRRI